MYIGLHVKYLLFLSNLKETGIFSTDFRKILKYKIPCKFAQWEPSCSMRTEGRTEMTKIIFAFCNFANASKNEFIVWPWITRRLYLQVLALSAL